MSDSPRRRTHRTSSRESTEIAELVAGQRESSERRTSTRTRERRTQGAVRSFVKIERISTLFLTPSATLQGIADVVSDVVSSVRDDRDGPARPSVASGAWLSAFYWCREVGHAAISAAVFLPPTLPCP
jgi:hypothetical protein